MWFFVWNSDLKKAFLWSSPISKIFLWNDLVWPIITTPIFRNTNWVIVATEHSKPDTEYVLDWVTYFVASNKRTVRNKIDSWFPANRIVTTKLIDMSWMMYWARDFNQDISTRDTSNVRRFDYLFAYCDSFNQSINNFNFKSISWITWIFFACKNFNQKIEPQSIPDNLNISWENLLAGCTLYNQPLWPLFKKFYNAFSMFAFCKNFDQDCSIVWSDIWWIIIWDSMYCYAENFNNNIPRFNSKSQYTISVEDMFAFASKFNQDVVTSLKGCKPKYLERMFSHASSFNQPLNDLDVSDVKSMMSFFNGATSFNQPLNKWDVRNVENMSSAFRETHNFRQDISNWSLDSLGNNQNNYEADNWSLIEPAAWAFYNSSIYSYQKPNLKWYSEYGISSWGGHYNFFRNLIFGDNPPEDIKSRYYDRDLN